MTNDRLKETFCNSFTQNKSQRSLLNEINEMEIDVSQNVCALEKTNQENSDSFKITSALMKPNKDENTSHHVSNLSQRRTLIFHQNDDIDCDISLITPVQVISEPTAPLQNLHSLENINAEKTDLFKRTNIIKDKTQQLKDCELSQFGSQTLIFNTENNDLQNELSFENDYQEKTDSFKVPIETSPNNFEITIESLKQISSPLSGSKTIIFNDEHDMDCDISQNKEHQDEMSPLKNNLPVEMMQNNVPPSYLNISETPTHSEDYKLPIKRLTCYYNDNDNIDLENSVQSKVENSCNNNRGRQTLYFNSADMDETKVNCEVMKTYKSLPSRQTLHFTEGNDMDLDNSIVANHSNNTELVKIAPTSNILNVAKHTLFKQFRHIGKDVQTLDGSVFKRRNNQCTTEKYMETTPLRTPHRSLIEFEYLEMTTKFDEREKEINRRYTNYDTSNIKFDETQKIDLKAEISGTNIVKVDAQRKIIFSSQDSQTRDPELVKAKTLEESGLKSLYNDKDMEDFPQDKCISPRVVEIGKKRTPINLTPNMPDAKKRQTVSYNCDMEVSFVASDSLELSNKNQKCPNRKTIIFSEEMKNADEYDQKIVVDDSIINIQNDTNITLDIREEYAKTKTSNCLEIQPKKNVLNLNLSDTIEIPRRAPTLLNLEKSLQYERNTMGDNSATMRKLQNTDIFEEPITISDVSVFYQSQRKVPDVSCVQINNIAKDEPAKVELISSDVCEDNTVNNIAKIKKLFINLPCDSPILGFDSDQIENTSLSLVRTQDDVDDDDKEVVRDLEIIAQEDIQGRVLNKQPAICTQPSKISYESLRNASIMCRKCKRCQESFLNETSTCAADSFVLPTLPPDPDIGMDELLKQRQRPTISDVTEYWQRKSLECSFNIEEWSFDLVTELDVDETDEDADALIAQYEEKFRRNELHYAQMQTNNMIVSFVKRLKTHIRPSNWIFDYQLQIRKFYEFLHRKIVTFSLVVHFLPIDPMGIDVNMAEVEIKHSRIPRKNWKPMHFVLDFQLKIELPYDLSTLYHSTDAFHNMVEMLNTVDGICINVDRLGHQLWKLVFKHNASLIREANATFVRKVVRKIVSNEGEYRRIQKTEFKIEITNIRKISYKDIVSPPLHLFREDIQYLPLGLDFLGEFLRDPMVLLNT